VLESGAVQLEGPAGVLQADEALRDSYLGAG